MGYIYRYPHIDLNEFNDYYVNHLFDKLSKEKGTVFLSGDFDIDLLNYDQHSPTNISSLTISLSICSYLILYNQQEKEIIPKL